MTDIHDAESVVALLLGTTVFGAGHHRHFFRCRSNCRRDPSGGFTMGGLLITVWKVWLTAYYYRWKE